ncbi:MAG: hypothetical protein HC837_03990 [Chloroflexaceae bacterium]|nr:hypothetical protein [Chloroflexaceae bacterium]
MSETIQSLLNQMHAAATVLDQPAVLELISSVQANSGSARLRLLMIGAGGSGRFALTNMLLQQPDLLTPSPLPRAPIPLQFSYGETTSAELRAHDGMGTTIAIERLGPFLTNPQSTHTDYQAIHIKTNSEMLKSCDLRIETIDPLRSRAEWQEVLAGVDYALLVLNAAALLSEHERRFIRDVLQVHVGLERVAIIINQIDLVADDERPSIQELMRAFLGPFESQPLLIEASAAQALAGLRSGSPSAESGYAVVMQLLQEDLIARHRDLKATAMRQAIEMCLHEMEQEAQRQQTVIAASEADLQELLARCNPQSQWLHDRIERARHRIEAFVNTLIKEQLMRNIEAFTLALREQLPEEIMAVDDLGAIRRNIPGYIETLWQEFFVYELTGLRNWLIDEMTRFSETITSDLRSLLGEQESSFQSLLTDFDPIPTSMKTFMMPSRGKHDAGTAATWLQVGGLGLLIFNPALSLGLIGAGQAVRFFFQRDIQMADKQAITVSVGNSLGDLEQHIKQQIDSQFLTLVETLNQAVAAMYDNGLSRMRATLEEQIARQHALIGKKEQIDQLLTTQIPALRMTLQQLGGRKHTL